MLQFFYNILVVGDAALAANSIAALETLGCREAAVAPDSITTSHTAMSSISQSDAKEISNSSGLLPCAD